jgi:hypothetical protein
LWEALQGVPADPAKSASSVASIISNPFRANLSCALTRPLALWQWLLSFFWS